MNTPAGERNCGPGKEGCQKEAAESRPEATDGGDDLTVLPDPPEKPLPTECCGSGCRPCVLDVYQEQLQEWSMLAGMAPEDRAKWRLEKRARECEEEEEVLPALSHSDYRSFTVAGLEQLTTDTFLFTFNLDSGQNLGLRMGQHILLRVCDEHGEWLVRQYTPVSPLDCKGLFQVAIKLYEGGRMSQCVRQWSSGSSAQWRGPFGNSPYSANKYSRLGLLACGSGIAPMIQIIRGIVENEEDETFVWLLYASRSENDIILKSVLDEWTCYWNFTVLYALSRTSEENVASYRGSIKYGDKVHLGRIDGDLLTRELPAPENRRNFVMVCGTQSFVSDMLSYLKALGYTEDMIFIF